MLILITGFTAIYLIANIVAAAIIAEEKNANFWFVLLVCMTCTSLGALFIKDKQEEPYLYVLNKHGMAKKKKAKTPMEKLTEGYEKFIKDKETNSDGKEAFEKTVKKVTKSRGSK